MRNLTRVAAQSYGSPGAPPWDAVAASLEDAHLVYAARGVRAEPGAALATLELAALRSGPGAGTDLLASVAVAAAPAPLPIPGEVVALATLADGGSAVAHAPALCVVTAGGDIVLLAVGDGEEGAGTPEIVGSIEQGVLAAAWSPDEEVLVLVSAADAVTPAKLLTMTREYEVLSEQPLRTDAFGEDHPVNLGWGSKTTQFHGSEGKAAAAAAAAPPTTHPRGPPVPEDDGLPRVSWRGDGAFFAVSSRERIDTGEQRVIRVYTRTGALSATSDPTVRGISHVLASRPVGNVIAATQRFGRAPDGGEWAPGREARHDVVFFERNGLRHGEFSLREEHGAAPTREGGEFGAPAGGAPWSTPHAVRELAWNADGSVLAVHLSRGATQVVQLWTTGNWHWYLKQELLLDSLRALRWHPEEPLQLFLVHDGGVERHVLVHETAASGGVPPHDAACVAVVDGEALRLTPFRLANVPPPMCAMLLAAARYEGAAPGAVPPPVHVAWASRPLRDGRSADLCAALFAGALCVWRITYPLFDAPRTGPRPPPELACVAVVQTDGAARQVALSPADGAVNVAVLGGGAAAPSSHGAPDDLLHMVQLRGEPEAQLVETHRSVYPLGGQRARRLVAAPDGRVCVHSEGGDVVLAGADRALEELQPLGRFCATLHVLPSEASGDAAGHETPTLLALASSGQLSLVPPGSAPHTIAKDASSFTVTDRLLVWTTFSHEARFLPLRALRTGSPSVLDLGRRVERGSRIVTAVPSAMALVLQMPRGNLETICPRPMVLEVVRDQLDRRAYGSALRICRAHRIDLNLLHDHNPAQFLNDLRSVAEQVQSEDHLNLLISGLRDEDVTQTLYRPWAAAPSGAAAGGAATAAAGAAAGGAAGHSPGKVNRLCDAFLSVLPEVDGRRYLTSILTAHVRKVPPDYEGALRVLHDYLGTDAGTADEACRYIIFLADADQLFRVALGMYDFALALLVAQHSQRDPREYVPFLRELRATQPEAYQRFRIDDHLGRHARALTHLAAAGRAEDEVLAYMDEHRLYREALRLWEQEPARQRAAYARFGDYLRARQRATEAATAYKLAGDRRAALDTYDAAQWQEALTLAHALLPPAEVVQRARALAAELEAREQHAAAASVLLEHARDLEQAVAQLCAARELVRAERVCVASGRADLVETHVRPAALDAQAELLEQVHEASAQLARQLARLTELEARRTEDPGGFYADEAPAGLEHVDVMSETVSQMTQFTRYTAAPSMAAPSASTLTLSTRGGKQNRAKQRKEERKRQSGRKGSVHEEAYLHDSLRRLLAERLRTLQLDAAQLLPVLLPLGGAHRAAASALQGALAALERDATAAAEQLGAQSAAVEQQRAEAEQALVEHVLRPAGAAPPLAALAAWRRTLRTPVRGRPAVAAEKWRLHLLEGGRAEGAQGAEGAGGAGGAEGEHPLR